METVGEHLTYGYLRPILFLLAMFLACVKERAERLQQQHQEAQSEVERATEERKRIEEELQASCRILGVSKAL